MLTDNAFFSGVEAASLVRVLPAFRLATFPPGATLYVRGHAARNRARLSRASEPCRS